MLGKEETVVAKPEDAVVILDSSVESENQSAQIINCRQHSSRTSTISAIRKRGDAFKTELCLMIRFAYGSSRNLKPSFLSLEELISMKDVYAFSEACETKSLKTRSLASGTHRGHLCQGSNLLQLSEMVEHLRKGFGIHGQIVHVEEIAEKAAVYTELPNDLSENTKAALKQIGIPRLYSHQADAVRASLSGRNIVVATSTSSGKSLCYNIPVIEELSQNPSSCALYLFPTKALAQDQLRALLEMRRHLSTNIDLGIYNGDTPQNDRASIRENVRLLITNPDMLHVSILPFHRQFQRLLSNLRFIVIDEAHTYKGAFGCHTSLILRRLCRICSHVYGIDPSFIFCTATSGNPREHAMELGNLQSLELIQNDGSPCGPKLFLLWNPPLRFQTGSKMHGSRNKHKSAGKTVNRRSSPVFEVSCLFAEMVQHGLRCIAFCKTRKLCELVLCYTREILGETAPDLVDTVSAYRGGYVAEVVVLTLLSPVPSPSCCPPSPPHKEEGLRGSGRPEIAGRREEELVKRKREDRRNIEIDLFGGRLRGVAATNALELGIDVGHIDATLHLGFPGSYASFWQQAGRSGRRMRPSLAVYVAFEGPLDQYFMKFPHKLFRNPVEYCKVDACNQQVLEQHLSCAAFELPLNLHADEKYFGNGLSNTILALEKSGHLIDDSSCKIWSYIGPEKKPSQTVSIRAIETEKYKVVDMPSNESLEEIEESRAFFQVYDGAVYINQGITYLVKALDLSAKIAFCQKADLKYYTKTRDYTDIHVNGGDLAYPLMVSEVQNFRMSAQSSPCKVTTNWFGFYRIWRGSNQIFDTVELSLPPYSYTSQAVFIRIPQFIRTLVEAENLSFRAGKHAASHALLNLAPLYLMCNASDLSTECANPFETRDIPDRLLLYDQHPGGLGLSMRLQPLFVELLADALKLIISCCCTAHVGCPNCVQSLACHEYNEVLDKKAAVMILKGLVEGEKTSSQGCKISEGKELGIQ
ncbi:hypothetical protein Taro_043825 [Colocasia esculenta]|uniref:Uncharacterized protein n=1 Tax=Colocasia esculenta TaxID=4460 RepID=A0A843WSD3_COLES|nr:hypothetical protein [Colocasia esculenta]